MLKEIKDRLIKNRKVTCTINGYTYKYLEYLNENEPPAVGYVKELFKGNKFSFYVRETKEYREGVEAKSSLERSFPARFIDKTEYFIAVGNGSLKKTKLSKKQIINSLSSYKQEIKNFIYWIHKDEHKCQINWLNARNSFKIIII